MTPTLKESNFFTAFSECAASENYTVASFPALLVITIGPPG